MPIFQYQCNSCQCEFEQIVISRQTGFSEPTQCPQCQSPDIIKIIGGAPTVRLDGKVALQTLGDPSPPLQELKAKGPRPGCTGGYADLPEVGKMERRRREDGNWEWHEKKRKYFT